MKKTVITLATVVSTLSGGMYYNDYQNECLPNAEQRIADELKPSFQYTYNGYDVNIKKHWVKGNVIWIDLEARKGNKYLDIDMPYGYVNINILRKDDREKAFKDVIHSTIVLQDKS